MTNQQTLNYVASGGRSFTSPDAQKPKSAAGTMVKGAAVGGILAGPAGAVVGAMVGKEKHDSKNK